jgi:hypothetical protein
MRPSRITIVLSRRHSSNLANQKKKAPSYEALKDLSVVTYRATISILAATVYASPSSIGARCQPRRVSNRRTCPQQEGAQKNRRLLLVLVLDVRSNIPCSLLCILSGFRRAGARRVVSSRPIKRATGVAPGPPPRQALQAGRLASRAVAWDRGGGGQRRS